MFTLNLMAKLTEDLWVVGSTSWDCIHSKLFVSESLEERSWEDVMPGLGGCLGKT